MSGGEALVLSGGGSLGAYQVGVLQALARGLSRGNGNRFFDPPLIVGTSVGAFNAAFLVAQGDVPFTVAVDRLKNLWLHRIADRGHGNGVFRYRFDPVDFVRGLVTDPMRAGAWLEADLGSVGKGLLRGIRQAALEERSPIQLLFRTLNLERLVCVEPLWRTIRGSIDFQRLIDSPRRLVVTAATWPELAFREFEGRDSIWRREGACILLAALAIPGIFPPRIVDGECLADGSVVANTPIGAAIRAGARQLHTILPMVLPWHGSGRCVSTGSLADLYLALAGVSNLQCFFGLREIELLDHHPARSREDHDPAEIDTRLHLPSESQGTLLWQLLDFGYERIERLVDRGFRDATRQLRFSPEEIIPSVESSEHFLPYRGVVSPYGKSRTSYPEKAGP